MLQGLGCRVEDALRLFEPQSKLLGEHSRAYQGDTRSLDYGSFGV